MRSAVIAANEDESQAVKMSQKSSSVKERDLKLKLLK